MDETTRDILAGLAETLIDEMNERLDKLKERYKDHPKDAGLSYEQGIIHGIDVAVQKIFALEVDNEFGSD